jgi:hypothetical protein
LLSSPQRGKCGTALLGRLVPPSTGRDIKEAVKATDRAYLLAKGQQNTWERSEFLSILMCL